MTTATTVDKIKISVVQFESIPYEPSRNYERIEGFIKIAASDHADIVVFPEYFITGALSPQSEHTDLADGDRKYITKLQALAKEYNIDIVPGTIVERNDAGHLMNTCYYIDAKGDILGSYEKINLWHPERDYLTSGTCPHQLIHHPRFGCIGLLVCWDIGFPESFRALLRQGAPRLIIAPSWWTYDDAGEIGLAYEPEAEAITLDAICTTRAFENECAFVFCNAAGDRSKGFLGHSQVCVPFKGPLVRLDNNEHQVSVTVDFEIVSNAQKWYKIRSDLADIEDESITSPMSPLGSTTAFTKASNFIKGPKNGETAGQFHGQRIP